MYILETKNLTKKFEKMTAVDNLNLQIKEGEIFGLLGPNGAGKTTTLLMLVTLKPPTSGTATINGFDIVKQPDKVRKSIGIVFQDPSSDEILTGYENLKLHGWLYDMPDELRESRIKEVLTLVDLTDRMNDRVKKYSGGMRRRLELARGLMHHPKVLFLDEPTLGLDPQSREHIWKYIENLAKEKNMTIIITTHYMDEADKLCDRLAIIDHGKIVVLGSPTQLKKDLGGDIIRLKAQTLDLDALKKLPYVKEITPSDGEVSLTLEDANIHLQEILKVVGKIDSVEIRSPTLDDVFLHYTGRAIREDTPEGSWAEKSDEYECEKMSEIKGIYALWYRETKVFIRERSRVISSIINPLLWLLIIGGGLGSAVSFSGVNFQTFIYPGILIQTALFSSVFFGVYRMDKKIDFMKEVLVAPMRRTSVFIGKILGGSTDTLLQILILFVIGFILMVGGIMPGLQLTPYSVLVSLAFLLMATMGLVSTGLIIGSQMESPEGFQLIMSFLVFPLFFLSGALFPITNLPGWLSPFIFFNPMTYAVDGIRGVMLGVSQFSLLFDFALICLFALVMILIGTYAFKKMKL